MRIRRTKPTPKIQPERCDSKAIIASIDSDVSKTFPIGSSLTRPTTLLSLERVSSASTPHVARERQLRGFAGSEALDTNSGAKLDPLEVARVAAVTEASSGAEEMGGE